jgi:hypothetical protein
VAYVDLLRMTVLLAAGAATALGAVTVISADRADEGLLIVAGAWWTIALAAGIVLGQPRRAAEALTPVLAAARTTPTMPTDRPGRVAVARLWPVAAFALVAGGLGFVIPAVSAVGTGFALLGAMLLRAREAAVTAVEDRDGVRFYVEPGSTFEPVRLVRTPGLRRERPPAGHPPAPPPAATG